MTPDLFTPVFDGKTFDPSRDGDRLSGQLQKVRAIMLDHQWHTLKELSEKTGASEAGASARIRDLKKVRFGGYNVVKERVEGGLWKYRIAA